MKKLCMFASMALLALTACNTTPATTVAQDENPQSVVGDKIAYVSSEMVLTQSEIFLTEGAAIRTKSEKAQASWAKSEQGFQYEINQLNEKYQKGLITTANAQKQQQAIEGRVASYQATAQKEAKTLEEENMVFSNRAQDLFRRAVAKLNEGKEYKMILEAALVIDADTSLDLSAQVLEIMNQLYADENSSSKK